MDTQLLHTKGGWFFIATSGRVDRIFLGDKSADLRSSLLINFSNALIFAFAFVAFGDYNTESFHSGKKNFILTGSTEQLIIHLKALSLFSVF